MLADYPEETVQTMTLTNTETASPEEVMSPVMKAMIKFIKHFRCMTKQYINSFFGVFQHV